MQDLNRKMARGAFWMVMLRISVRSLSLVSTVVLARLLVPADFGLVAMATSIVAFLELATAFSFDIALIQKQQATRQHFDTAWTLNLIFYGALSLLLLALAEPAAAFYQEERLTNVIYVLAAGFFVKGFENIGVVYFRKELKFKDDFLLLFSRKLVTFVITIPLALYFRSYWALVVGIAAGNAGGVLLTYMLHPFRPTISLATAGEMLNFSRWLLLNNAIGFLRMRSPDFILGRLSGSSALGLFTVAYEISTLPTTEIVAPINRVVFPGYSKLSSDLKSLRNSYLEVLSAIAFLSLPAAVGISAVAAPLVDVVLGGKWAGAAPIVATLAIFGGLSALLANNGAIYYAVGKPYMITMLGGANVAILVSASIALVPRFGAAGIAAAYLGTTILYAPISLYVVGRELGVGLRQYLSVLWRPFLCSSLMYFGVVHLAKYLTESQDLGSFLTLVTLVPVGVLIYVGSTAALWAATGRPRTIDVRLAGLVKEKIWARSAPSVPPAT